MNIQFDKIKLRKVLQDFYNCTQIPITLFDSNFQLIDARGKPCEFCNVIRNYPLLSLCENSDITHSLEAKEKKGTLIYTCHAGILESVTPIFHQGVLIAYLMLGKIRDKEREYSLKSEVKNFARKYNLDTEQMLKLYNKLPILSHNNIASAISILEICIKHIWNEHLIKINMSMLSTQIDDYISENITGDLTVSKLCRQFYTSKEKLYALFKEEFNDTIKNYILTKKLDKAALLLKNTKSPISEIAYQSGFQDYNYFIRIFKNKYNTTPLQYRKQFEK